MASKATLKEVAARAGVSYQTVSKVLNKQIQVSKETEERILLAVRELDYKPNQIARNLRDQRTRLIGYSWEPAPEKLPNSILDQFLQSMAQQAEHSNYHILCFPHAEDTDRLEGYRELIDTNRVDAFVLSGIEYADPRILFLQEREVPFVAFGRSNPEMEFSWVDVDGAAGMRAIVQHLVSLGHRRIAAIAWPEVSRVGQNRMEGLLTGLAEAGITLPADMLIRSEGTYETGYKVTTQLLDMPILQRPTAIICFNDAMAIGAVRSAQKLGLVVGRDIAITGFDDMPMSEFLSPPLTSVTQPIRAAGQRVMEILLSILDNPLRKPTQVLLEPHLTIRGSSGSKI